MIKPDHLTNYRRKVRLRQCVNGTCSHSFCSNRNLKLSELQPTTEEKEANNKYHNDLRNSTPLHKARSQDASNNWKIHNPDKVQDYLKRKKDKQS